MKKKINNKTSSPCYSIFNSRHSPPRGFAPTPIFASLHRVFFLLCLLCRSLRNDRLSPAYGNATKALCKNRFRGFGLVEVVIGSAVLSVALLGISGFFQTVLRASRVTESAVQGDYLLEEGVEVLKIFRDAGYVTNLRNLSTTTAHYYLWTGTAWATTTTNTFIDGVYERKFTIGDVNRDANSDIATVGTYDPDVKLATVSVAWWSPVVGTTTRSIQTYITNIFNN